MAWVLMFEHLTALSMKRYWKFMSCLESAVITGAT